MLYIILLFGIFGVAITVSKMTSAKAGKKLELERIQKKIARLEARTQEKTKANEENPS